MTTYDFETGSAGNGATLANTGASLLNPGGHQITISGFSVISGANSLEFKMLGTTGTAFAEFAGPAGTQRRAYIGWRLPADGYSVDTTVANAFAADDTTVVGRLTVRASDHRLAYTDVATAHTLVISANISANYGDTVAVRLQLDQTAGSVLARYYVSPTAAVGTYTTDVTSGATVFNLGTGGFGKTRIGVLTAQTSLGTDSRTTRFDYLVVEAGTGWVTPPAAVTAPTANAGADQYGQTGTTFHVTASGTPGTSGGSINSTAWSLVSKSNPNMSTPAFATPNAAGTDITNLDPGVYVVQAIVGQTGGGLFSAPDPVSLWVHPPSGVPVKPRTVTKAAGITREGTAATDEAAISDGDDTTLLQWGAPAGEEVTIVWNPCGPSNPVLSFKMGKLGSGTLTATVLDYLEDGTTLIDGPYTQALTTTATPVPAGLGSGALTALGSTLANRRALVSKVSVA